jgi:bifunctional DNA-binding transcriptional regulator/antitoxin component of YhaV-PrlF toxin-antitoxin module
MTNTVKKQVSSQRKLIRRISRGHQVTLPPHFLKENGLHIGDSVEILEEKGKVTIQPVTIVGAQDKSRLIETIQSLFSEMDNQISKEKKLNGEELILQEINQEIEQSRKL